MTLKIAGTLYGGWEAIDDITRSIETLSGGFSLTVAERWPGQQAQASIKQDDACSLAIDGETIITGYIDDVDPEYDAANHKVTIRGRDAAGDLVDCSAIASPGWWNQASLLDIAAALCKDFRIKVSATVPVGSFVHFALQPGERVFEALERLCASAGVLPVSDGLGDIVLTRAGAAGKHAGIALGGTILKASGHFSAKDRFSDYFVIGQSAGSDFVDPRLYCGWKGEAKDPGVKRYRPLIIMANIVAPSADVFQRRAEWEASVRLGRAWRATVTVPGWRDAAGKLWKPNAMVPVTDEFLGVNSELLISGVKFHVTDEGELTDLTVTRREAFDLIPLPDIAYHDPAAPSQPRLFPPPAAKDGKL